MSSSPGTTTSYKSPNPHSNKNFIYQQKIDIKKLKESGILSDSSSSVDLDQKDKSVTSAAQNKECEAKQSTKNVKTVENDCSLRVFIARIPGNTTDEDIISFFSKYGKVLNIKLDKRSNGKCSGSGCFDLDNESGFETICKEKHVFMGRNIIATKYLDKEKMSSDSNAYHKRKVVITKVPPYMTQDQIKSLLEAYGPLENIFQVRVSGKQDTTIIEKNRTFQAIFAQLEDVKKRIPLNGKLMYQQRRLKIRLFMKKLEIDEYKMS